MRDDWDCLLTRTFGLVLQIIAVCTHLACNSDVSCLGFVSGVLFVKQSIETTQYRQAKPRALALVTVSEELISDRYTLSDIMGSPPNNVRGRGAKGSARPVTQLLATCRCFPARASERAARAATCVCARLCSALRARLRPVRARLAVPLRLRVSVRCPLMQPRRYYRAANTASHMRRGMSETQAMVSAEPEGPLNQPPATNYGFTPLSQGLILNPVMG